MRLASITVLAAACVALTPLPSQAMNWSLGANLGMSILMPEDADNVTFFSWPSSALFGLFTVPGIRVGFAGDNPQHEFYVDTALMLASTESVSLRTTQINGNYQYNFSSTGSNSPFITGGVGFASLGSSNGSDVGASSIVFGAGAGLRHKMGNGHGVLRGEVRYDRISEAEDSGSIIFPESGLFSLKLGFDMWD